MKKGKAKDQPSSHTRDTREAKNMYRLKLGKTQTEFFSEKGNTRLKRIWLENNLDEEMIFSSWIGPSEAFLRQKVSDYVQSFLLHRSLLYASFYNVENIKNSKGFSLTYDISFKRQENPRFEHSIRAHHQAVNIARENAEKHRIAKSIACGDLPTMPGFEYVVKHPIFKAQEMEKRMQQLCRIPLPGSASDFEKYVLPIMTALAISKEKTKTTPSKEKVLTKTCQFKEYSTKRGSSGLSDDSGISFEEFSNTFSYSDSDLVQLLSHIETDGANLDETPSDSCEDCGGIFNGDIDELACSCISDQIFNCRHYSTASTLYKEAAKIVDLCIREKCACADFLKQFKFKPKLK